MIVLYRNVPPQPMGSPRREENAYPPHRQQAEDALPAILEFREDSKSLMTYQKSCLNIDYPSNERQLLITLSH